MSEKESIKTDEKTRLTDEDNLEKEKVADGAVADGHTPGSDEESKVKFIGNGGASPDEVKVEVLPDQEAASKKNEFTGLTKEELARYSEDPFWVKVRWALLILFWVAWFGMLAAAIVIIVLAPKCPPRPKLDWWQNQVSYQCYPRSFKDSNGDGIGDIKGIKEKLPYVKDELNAKTLRINSLLKSGKSDYGNEIQDFKDIDPAFGTLEEFKHTRIDLHKKGMKLIMDFVANHGSVNSTWFKEASKDRSNKYRNYFIWADGKSGGVPNNWKSVNGGSAWTLHSGTNQYYFHQFSESQPDLNLYNPEVRKEIEDAIRFWLEQGVDGLHIVGAAYLFESNSTDQNEPQIANPPSGGTDYDTLNHTLTKFQPDTFKILTDWRKIVDEVSSNTDKPRALIVDGEGGPEMAKLMEYNELPGAHLVSNPSLIRIDESYNSVRVKELVKSAVASWPQGKTANWMLGSPDTKRVASRVNPKYRDIVQMLFMTLPGTPESYYGEEIGMTDNLNITGKGQSRHDPSRTPMQWTNGPNAGFTVASATPWLPINSNYPTVNVKSSQAAGAGHNGFKVYQELTKLHLEPSILWGELHFVEASDTIFSYVRQAKGFPGYLIALNFDNTFTAVDFRNVKKEVVAEKGVVVANTGNFDHNDFKVGSKVNLDNIILRPGQGVVFKWEPEAVNQQM